MCQQVRGSDGTATQQQPLVLDLLDANGHHINDSVLHIAWANANGAFLLAAATKSTIVVFSLLRYFQWLLGDLETISEQGPLAEQLCVVEQNTSDTITALDWTHKADGLLCADSSGGVRMLAAVTSGMSQSNEAQFPRLDALEALWEGKASESQTLLSSGKTAFSPAASASMGSKMVHVWWPPQPPDAALSDPAAAAKQEATSSKPAADTAGFSSETLAVLKNLGAAEPQPAADDNPDGDALPNEAGTEEVHMEQLRHTAPVAALQWSGADLLHGAEDGEGPAGVLLPPAQPALLTMTHDGIIRIWVEVKMAPQPRLADGTASPNGAPAWGAAGAQNASHFCVTLVIQPPAGAWDLSRGMPRVCWAVPSGPEPATRPELQAEDPAATADRLLLWAVAGLSGVVIGGRPGSSAPGRGARAPRAGPQTLSASVTLAEDIPVLRSFEAAASNCGERTELRAHRLDTVEDDETMVSSLPLPTSPGSALPPRHLQVHDLTQMDLLGHPTAVQAVLPSEGLNSAATLGEDGRVLLWRLSPLKPLQSLTLPRTMSGSTAGTSDRCTALAWLDHSSAQQRDRGQCLLAAASSSGVFIFAWRSRQQKLRRAGNVSPTLLTTLALPPNSGVVRWLQQRQSASGSPEPAALTLLAWLARADTEFSSQRSGSGDVLAVWQIRAGEGGIEGSLVAARPIPGLDPTARITCMAHSCGRASDAVAGDSAGCLHVLALGDDGTTVKAVAKTFGNRHNSAVVAIASACGGTRVGAAMADRRLMVYDAQLGDSGALEYALTADVSLPSAPTDFAALPLPAPAFAVGCTGRGFIVVCRDRNGSWQTLAALSPTPLPGAKLAPLKPPGLLLAALGNQLKKHRGLTSPGSSSGYGDQSLAELALKLGGPRAPWDPLVLRGLLLRGRRAAAVSALRQLLARLQSRVSADGLHHGSADQALDSSAAQAVSAELLAWARQVSRAATDSTSAPGDTSNADILSQSGRMDQTVNSSNASAEGQTVVKAPPADPYAFDMSSFNGSGAGGNANATSSAGLEQDPFAFNMDAFGMSAAAETKQNGRAERQLQQGSKSGNGTDPFAFSMDDFGGAGSSMPQAGDDAASPDPYAADRGDTSAASSGKQGDSAAKAPSSAADPFAFDMSAFGMAAAPEPLPEQKTSSGNKPSAADRDTEDASMGALPDRAAAPAADPFAFDMGAFGLGGAPLSDLATEGADNDPFAADRGGSEDRSQIATSSKPAANAADPFAFDAGAFGMGEIAQPVPAAEITGTNPFASERSSTTRDLQNPNDILTGTLDPAAFGMGATSTATSAQSESLAASGGGTDADSGQSVPDQAPGRVEADRALRSGELEASTSYSGGMASGAKSGITEQQPSEGCPPAKWQAALAKPLQENFEPLSATEFQDMQRLLCSAVGVEKHCMDQDGEEGKGGNGLATFGADNDDVLSQLGLEGLGSSGAAELLGLAGILAKTDSSSKSLDEPAQRLLTSLQVSLVSQAPAADTEGAASSRKEQIPRSSSSLASLLSSRGAVSSTAEDEEEGGWEKDVGLSEGVDMRAVLWALMSQSTGALLDACMAMVPANEEVEVKQEPKIDFTYSGQKKIDLGFGFGTAAPAAAQDSAKQLSWERMRKAGAGFWLTDAKAVRQQAEALAKAQFAARRDPHDCALMYIALGKKTLLQGLFRSAQHKKQSEFLGRAFNNEKDRAAAAKNAFVLLAQHRPQLAAAFFILAGQLRDAVGVCANELADPQLAIFLCRLLEPTPGPLLRHLLADELLPRALDKQDAWGAAALEWLLGQPHQALQTLLSNPARWPQPAQVARSGASAEAQLLDFVYYSTAAQIASLALGPATLGTLRQLAQRSATGADAAGMPDLALEAATLAETCALPRGSDLETNGQLHGVQAIKTELAAAALLRLTLDACRRAYSDAGRAWRAAVQAGLTALQEKGISVEAEPVLERLAELAALLQLEHAPHPAEEPATPFSESSSRLSFSRDRRSGSLRGSVGGFAGTLYDGGWVVQQLHDKIFSVCAAQAGDWSGDGRPFVAATAHKGLLELEVTPQQTVDASEAASFSAAASDASSAAKGFVFSALLTDMMEAVRWPAAATSADTTSPLIPAAAAGSPRSSPKAAARALTSMTSSSALNPKNSPTARVSAHAEKIATVALASHPFRPLYLSGSATGEIFLWQLGGKQAIAGYTPIPATIGASPPPASASIFATPSRAWTIDRPGALAALGHWGQPQSVCFSEGGERFAAIGQGGMAAAWRLDAPQYTRSDSGPLARSDWCHQVLSKRGVDIAFVGGSSSVLAAGGYCSAGGNIVLWDTLAPISGGPIAFLTHHAPLVTVLQVLPGGRLLAAADEAGAVSVSDLRMLGTARKALLWQAKSGSAGVTCLASGPRPGLVSGSREGIITSWAVDTGTTLQTIDVSQVQPASKLAPPAKGYSFFSDVLKSARQTVAPVITGLASCPEGLISSCLDGTVRFHPML
ncbi:probable DmX-like protein 2 at C-terminar half [Coccomyxa sp. Obi]|nr:probable DmX-like protein 2 at C-terminar half [Coccomyxa sp. Obi]